MLEVIEASAERAAGLVKQLMTFARKEVPQRELIRTNDIIDEVVRLLRKIIPENIVITTRVSEEPLFINADPIQIKQTLFNICINARDAMPDGGKLTIEALSVQLSNRFAKLYNNIHPGDYVQITISDTGVGISQERMERIFEPFYTSKPTGKGTGLGLSVSYGIIDSHQGTITADSEIGIGTTFRIYIPIAVKSNTHEKKRPVIVVVDSEPSNRRLLRLTLGGKDYEILTYSRVDDAIMEFPPLDKQADLIFISANIVRDNPNDTFEALKSLGTRTSFIILGQIDSNYLIPEVYRVIVNPHDVTKIMNTVNSIFI